MTRLVRSGFLLLCVACGSSTDEAMRDLAAGGDRRDTAKQELLLRPKQAVAPLLKAIVDPELSAGHAEMAEILVGLMLRLDDPHLVSELQRHVGSHPDPAVRARIASRAGLAKRAELLPQMMEALHDSVPDVRYEALKTLSILNSRLSAEQTAVLDAMAPELADDPHEGIRSEGLLRVESRVDADLKDADQMLTQARVAEAGEILRQTAERSPRSWKAKYRYARFEFDNGQRSDGLRRLRQIGTVIDVAPATGVIDIDGRLDEPAWQKSGQVELPFQSYRGYVRPAELTTRVHLTYSADALYVGLYCHDDYIDSLEANLTEHDSQVWTEESVEIFLDSNLDRRSYVQIITSAIGTLFDSSMENGLRTQDKGYAPALEAAAYTGPDFWSAELRISYDDRWVTRPESGDMWGANFGRNFRDRSQSTQWVYTYGDYHQVDGFGLLVFQ